MTVAQSLGAAPFMLITLMVNFSPAALKAIGMLLPILTGILNPPPCNLVACNNCPEVANIYISSHGYFFVCMGWLWAHCQNNYTRVQYIFKCEFLAT